MNHTDSSTRGEATWRQSLRRAVRDSETLVAAAGLPSPGPTTGAPADLTAGFPVLATASFVSRIAPGDPRDPLLLQVLPQPAEQEAAGALDPVGDRAARIAPGILHKYHGRVLLLVAGTCAIHCRYCFRRHYPYGDEPRSLDELAPAIEAIERDPSIREVILSGGDPLTRTDAWLAPLAHRLAKIEHVETLRLHTRVPTVLPDRVDRSLIEWLTGTRLRPVVVLHVNHPNELVGDCEGAIERLRRAGVTLLNQSVLLRGINDDVDALEQLSRRLLALGVLPYYLHQLDRATGVTHFEVPLEEGRELVEELRRRLPGYLVPRYVVEVPGADSKTPLA